MLTIVFTWYVDNHKDIIMVFVAFVIWITLCNSIYLNSFVLISAFFKVEVFVIVCAGAGGIVIESE